MKSFRWSSEKNESLAADRGVSFEIVTVAIGADGLLDILAHPNQKKYPRQRVFVVAVDGYAYLVPFVEEDDYVCAFHSSRTPVPLKPNTSERSDAFALLMLT